MLDDLPKGEIAFLASPYSHPDPAVRERRYQQAAKATAYLICHRGMTVFSPIVHSHPLALIGGLDACDLAFWQRQNKPFMDACYGGLIVLKLDGWKESVGVQAEIAFMRGKRRQIEYLDPADIEEAPQ